MRLESWIQKHTRGPTPVRVCQFVFSNMEEMCDDKFDFQYLKVVIVTWKMQNLMRWMNFLRFVVSEIWSYCTQNWSIFQWILGTRLTITQNIKIVKIGKLIFYSFQFIAYRFCKFEHFWKIFEPDVSPVNCKYNQP